MIAAVINHLWQSTLFACGAGLLTLAVRRDGAGVRYGLWFAASVKFLIPFALLAAAGGAAVARLHAPIAPPAALAALAPVVEPMATATATVAAAAAPPTAVAGPTAATFDWEPILLGVWALGLAAVLLAWARRWSRIHAALRAATPSRLPAPVPVLSTPLPMEPGVVGLFRPVVIVPEGIAERLSPAEWKAVLAHELCHIRRRDNLTGLIHMLAQALFWFHPLVWWLGARLVAERERACDEAVVGGGADARTYAEGILKVCRLYVRQPLACAAGVSGGDLKQRVGRILTGLGPARLGRAKTIMLAGTGVLSVAAPLFAGALAWTPTGARAAVAALRAPEPLRTTRSAPLAARQSAAAGTVTAQAAKPIVLAALDAVASPAPDVPAIRRAEGVAALSQATPQLPAPPDPASSPSEDDKPSRPGPAPAKTAADRAGESSRFGGLFRLTEAGPQWDYWLNACHNWHVRSQARRDGRASPAMNAAFRRFIAGLIANRPDYDDLSPAMAEAVRSNLPIYWPSLNSTGHATVATKFDTTSLGEALYVLNLTGGLTHWNLVVDADGKITAAFYCSGPGL